MMPSACPFLPDADGVTSASWMRRFGSDRGAEFYAGALRCAQGLWLAGKPAQSILQLNRAWSAALSSEDTFVGQRLRPYQALVWMLKNRQRDAFMGNPVRHFQHLASRMSGPRSEIRAWRAWACFWLAEWTLGDSGEFPRDDEQIENEALEIPEWEVVLAEVARHGWPGEMAVLKSCMSDSASEASC